MGVSQSKKHQHKTSQGVAVIPTAHGVSVIPQPLVIAPGDFQKTTLDPISHRSNEFPDPKDIGSGSRDKVGNGISRSPLITTKRTLKRPRHMTPKNHNTPMSPIEPDALDAELLCSLLRFHCEARSSVAHTRVMAPPRPKPEYADTRIQYPPGFHDLDVDIILKILQYYVAVQTDGVFILTLVSKSWSSFVLSSPILWQWVTIDSLSPDWVEKASFCFALSGSYPLQIIIRLPIMAFDNVFPLLGKCQSLFIEVPDYIPSKDVEETTRRLVSIAASNSCHVHWYRAGEALLTESREPFTADLSSVTSLHLNAEGSEHPHYHLYAQTRDMRFNERGDAYHPLILLKIIRILQVLQNAYYLRHLMVSQHSMDPIFLDLDLPVVVMIHLEELDLRDIDFARNRGLVPLVQSLRCPNLTTLLLAGQSGDVLETIYCCNLLGHPGALNLRFETYKPQQSGRVSPFNLPSVVSLSLHIMFPRLKDDEILDLARDFNGLSKTLRGLLGLSLLFPPDWFGKLDELLILSPVVWERLHDFAVSFAGQSTHFSALNYTWNAPQSILSISGITALAFRLLDILGGARNPATLRVKPRAKKAAVHELKFPLPSVKSLHLEIEEGQPQIRIIQDITCLVNMLPQLSEMYFLIPPNCSDWVSPYLKLMPTQPHLVRVLGFKTETGRNIILSLDRTKYFEPSITVLSGVSDVTMEFARMLGSLGNLSMTRIGLPEHCSPSIRFHCLRISDSNLKVAEQVVFAAGENVPPNSCVSLQCVGTPLHPDEIACLVRSMDQIEGALGHRGAHHLEYLRRPNAFGIRDVARAKTFRAISIRVERQHHVGLTRHYIADKSESILSLSGAVVPALQLLEIVAETGYLLPSFHGGTPNESPPLSPRASVTSLRLHIEDNWDWKNIAVNIIGLIATIPQLSTVHFIHPISWWRRRASNKIPQEDQVMRSLYSRNKGSPIGTPSAAERLFLEFISLLLVVHSVHLTYGPLRKDKEDNIIAIAPTYLGNEGQVFNNGPHSSMVSTIAPFPRQSSSSDGQDHGLRSDCAFILATLARHGGL
jgi:hypothetical protein